MQIDIFAYKQPFMEKQVFISIYLDTRRAKETGKFPVKLRVFTSNPRKQKLYPTKFEMSKADFHSIWETTKPRTEYKKTRLALQEVETKANKTAEDLNIFTFEQFEKKLYRKNGAGADMFFQYAIAIDRLKENKQIGTASNYDLALKSIKEFLIHEKGKVPANMPLNEISKDWLEKFETYMVKTMGKSRTTLSMYVRTLRTVYNNALSENEIEREFYPFGKRKYQVPATKRVKKALTKAELKLMFETTPKTRGQQRAKDFWFFSFICNGMNMKDIALLRYKDMNEDSFVFYRAKTINTSKADLKPITVYLSDFAKEVIAKYGNPDKKPENLVFSIISDQETEETNFFKVKNFTSNINKNLKKFAEEVGLSVEISTYWARHSFATSAIRNGASMEFVGEALNHSNPETTIGYFAGFEEKDKKEIMKSLLSF